MPSGVYEHKKGKESHNWGKHWDLSAKTKNKMREGQKGHLVSKATRKKISDSNKGEKSYNWKGDNVSPHFWIKREFGEPKKCENREKQTLSFKCAEKGHTFDWSNKDHKYRKIREDWQRLCKSCHMKYDYRYNNKKLFGKICQA